MFNITKNRDATSSYVVEITADSASDIPNLPTAATSNIAAGSTCLVIATSEVYILNNQDEWVKL